MNWIWSKEEHLRYLSGTWGVPPISGYLNLLHQYGSKHVCYHGWQETMWAVMMKLVDNNMFLMCWTKMWVSIHGDTQNGWFIRENPSINWDLGIAPFQQNPICISRNILRYVKPSLPSLQGTREVLRSLRASPFQSFVAKDLAKGKVAFSNAFLRRWGLMRSNGV